MQQPNYDTCSVKRQIAFVSPLTQLSFLGIHSLLKIHLATAFKSSNSTKMASGSLGKSLEDRSVAFSSFAKIKYKNQIQESNARINRKMI